MKTLKLNQGETGLELEHSNGNWILLKEQGYSPVQILVASIGACGQYVFKSVMEKSSIQGTLRNVNISYEVDEQSKSHQLTKVFIEFELQTSEENLSKANRALRLVNDYCPVIQSLNSDIIIEKTIKHIV